MFSTLEGTEKTDHRITSIQYHHASMACLIPRADPECLARQSAVPASPLSAGAAGGCGLRVVTRHSL